MFEPITLLIAISLLPVSADVILTAASGALVPIATIVRPITTDGTRNNRATADAPSTKKSAPLINKTNPTIRYTYTRTGIRSGNSMIIFQLFAIACMLLLPSLRLIFIFHCFPSKCLSLYTIRNRLSIIRLPVPVFLFPQQLFHIQCSLSLGRFACLLLFAGSLRFLSGLLLFLSECLLLCLLL